VSKKNLPDDILDFENHLRIKVELAIPEFAIKENFHDWALALLERDTWGDFASNSFLKSIDIHDQLFVQAFLQMSQLLFVLGRLPIFDSPKIISLLKHPNNPRHYYLELELFLIQFVNQAAYQIPVKASLQLCQWMSQNKATSENKNKAFKIISDKVIKPLHRLVPSGKSTIPVLAVAHRLRIPFNHLGSGVYQIGWGSKSRWLDRSTCELDSAIGSKLAQNKVSTANILRVAGLPAPVHYVVTTENDGLTMAKKIGFPVVIKPTDRDRGEGVTVDVSDEAGLKKAFAHAQTLSKSKQVIVERQILGVCHRFFIFNDKLLYAVKRHPMSVIGDGSSTVLELVDAELAYQNSKPPWNRSDIKPIDDLALKTFEKLGFSTQTVPGKGVMVPLRPIESTEWGGVDEDVTDVINPQNINIALRAAELFGLHIAGIDIISPDIAQPWYANGAIINEVNFAPLFGGAEISRSHIPSFFKEFIDGDGKIPIEVFNAETAALTSQKQQIKQGRRCYLTSSEMTYDDLGNEIYMPFKGLNQRIRALLMRQDVDALAIILPD